LLLCSIAASAQWESQVAAPNMYNLNTGNVGIGKTNPGAKLDVNGIFQVYPTGSSGTTGALKLRIEGVAGASIIQANSDVNWANHDIIINAANTTGAVPNHFVLYRTGNVAIGKAIPAVKLDVNGATQIYPNGNSGVDRALKLRFTPGTSATIIEANSDFNWANHDIIVNAASASGGNINQLVAHRSGNVGIGTASPDQKLTVKGYIHAEEVRVDLNVPGPDYVFEKNYELLTLQNLEQYINQHKHLPEVPSATEMEANGVYLKEMNMLLLKKVEELTLHLIELNKQVQTMNKTIDQLKSSH